MTKNRSRDSRLVILTICIVVIVSALAYKNLRKQINLLDARITNIEAAK